jgi:competence protein ComEA
MGHLTILAGSLLAVFVLGLFPVASPAADRTKTTAGDRINRPTKIKPLDINSGSVDDLKALPGIDDAYAQRIVAGRPYEKRDDLVSRKILPQAIYNKIKDRIVTVESGGK